MQLTFAIVRAAVTAKHEICFHDAKRAEDIRNSHHHGRGLRNGKFWRKPDLF
jgi:hypothetical protein